MLTLLDDETEMFEQLIPATLAQVFEGCWTVGLDGREVSGLRDLLVALLTPLAKLMNIFNVHFVCVSNHRCVENRMHRRFGRVLQFVRLRESDGLHFDQRLGEPVAGVI